MTTQIENINNEISEGASALSDVSQEEKYELSNKEKQTIVEKAKGKRGRKPKEKIEENTKEKKSDLKKSSLEAIKFLTKNMQSVHIAAEDDSEEYIDTGNLALNYIFSGKFLDGGIPKRKVIEIFGPSQSAKSAFGYIALGSVQQEGGIGILLDSEGGRNNEFMKKLGVDLDSLIILEPKDTEGKTCFTIERCFLCIMEVIKTIRKEAKFEGPVFILLDSIAFLPSNKEWRFAMENKEIKEDQGNRAKLINTYYRTLNGILRDSDTTIAIINQLRDAVGVMFGNKEVTTSGKSTQYLSDLRIDIRKKKSFTRGSYKNIVEGKSASDNDDNSLFKGKKLGAIFKVTCDKSRTTSPYRKVDKLELFFSLGVSPLSGLFDVLLDDDIIMKFNARKYCLVDPNTRDSFKVSPWEGRADFFKKEVLLGDWVFENYDVFGASSKQELVDYIEKNKRAYEFSRQLYSGELDGSGIFIQEEDEDEGDGNERIPAAVRIMMEREGVKMPKQKVKKSNIPLDELGDDEKQNFDDDDIEEV